VDRRRAPQPGRRELHDPLHAAQGALDLERRECQALRRAARGRPRRPRGLQAFERRSENRTAIYSYEQRKTAELGEAFEARFRADAAAWEWFQAQAPSYRRTATYWVVSAKRAETRERRLAELIADSAAGRRIRLLTRPGDRR